MKTYTQILKDLDEGNLPIWTDIPAPPEAIRYWGLAYNATFRDVILSIRADEVSHREFNHHLASIPKDTAIEGHLLEIVNLDKENEKKETSKENKI